METSCDAWRRGWVSWVAAAALTAAWIGAAACASAISDGFDDATITARVKTALLNDVEIGGFGLEVTTRQGIVTLRGQVSEVGQIGRAVAIARRVDGVTEVVARVGVRPGGTPPGTAAPSGDGRRASAGVAMDGPRRRSGWLGESTDGTLAPPRAWRRH